MRVVELVPAARGGLLRHARSVSAGLLEAGHDVVLAGPAEVVGPPVTPVGAAPAGASLPGADEPVDAGRRRLGTLAVPLDRASPVRVATTVARLARVARHADVVHAHGVRAGAVAALALAPARRRPALLVTWHNPGASRFVEVLAAWRADLTLGASADLVDRARRRGAGTARTVAVVAPARAPVRSPGQVREELDVPAGRPLVVTVGRLVPQKGVDVLVSALDRLDAARRPVVLVVGDGPSRPALESAARGLDVRFLGARDDVPDLLRAADVVVVASRWEARGLVAQEAARLGRPLVATEVGGLPELLGPDGGAALCVPPDDVRALAAAVSGLLADPEGAADLGRRAAARAATWPDEAAGVADVLDALRAAVTLRGAVAPRGSDPLQGSAGRRRVGRRGARGRRLG